MRDVDLIARLSDDDLRLLLDDTRRDQCTPLAERISMQATGISVIVDDDILRPRVHIEAVKLPVDGRSSDDIISTAEPTSFGPPRPGCMFAVIDDDSARSRPVRISLLLEPDAPAAIHRVS